jgi:hypothetical protein
MHNDKLEMWTIYQYPSDYPGDFVARKQVIGAGVVIQSDDMFTADTLDEIRKLLPRGLVRMMRHPNDDPKIIEVWM